jgi:hypothetical protein
LNQAIIREISKQGSRSKTDDADHNEGGPKGSYSVYCSLPRWAGPKPLGSKAPCRRMRRPKHCA